MILNVAVSLLLISHATLETVKNQFLEKNVGEAVFFLKNNPKILKTSQSQQQVAQWLANFQYDSTLSLFEKTLDLIATPGDDPDEIEKNFLSALEREPYNTKLLSHTIAFWLDRKDYVKAREKIEWAQQELPFMEIYKVYAVWLGLREKQIPSAKVMCKSGTLLGAERDYCFYVSLLEMVAESKAKKPTPEIMKAFHKTMVPNRRFVIWEKWQITDEKQKYLSSCRPLSGRQKKVFLMVPEFCRYDVKDAEKES